MFPSVSIHGLGCLLCSAALTANAQSPGQSSPAAPAGLVPAAATTSSAPALPFGSALAGYQPFAETKVQPWRDTNDTVGRVGGWRAYSREARAPQADNGVAPALAAPDPHAGHGKP